MTTLVQLLRLQLLRLLRASARTLGGLACWLEDRTRRSSVVAPTSVPPHLQGAPAHWLALVAEHAPGLLDPHPPVDYGAPPVEGPWGRPPSDRPARAATPVPAPPGHGRFVLQPSRSKTTGPALPASRVREEIAALAARSRRPTPRVGEAPTPATAPLRTSVQPAPDPAPGGPTRYLTGVVSDPPRRLAPVAAPRRPEPGTLPRMRRLAMFDPSADRSTTIEHPLLADHSTDTTAGSRPPPAEDPLRRSVAEWVPPGATPLTAPGSTPSPQPWPSLPQRPHSPAPARLKELLRRWREDLDRVQEETGWSGSSSS